MDYFSTSDFPLATTLLTLGYRLYSIGRRDPRRAEFLFEENATLQETIDKYWRGDLGVEPRAWCNAQKMLKARLYSNESFNYNT